MNATSIEDRISRFSRLKLFLALSRTPHGLLDMTTPALCALLWLGHFPSPGTIFLGLVTAFSGYTAVYALNDLIDYRIDREKAKQPKTENTEGYLDDVWVRHPMALGALSFREGLAWTVFWGLVALAGAYILNPACVLIFLAACLLETAYCLLFRISHYRAFVSGAVKTSGGMAAVFAVDPSPSPLFLSILFLWLFCWEIGGQNIPHDWNDIEEDRLLDAQTIPVRFGPERSGALILYSLGTAMGLSFLLLFLSPFRFDPFNAGGFLLAGFCLLILPAFRLYRTKSRRHIMDLFNKASYYPFSIFVLVAAKLFG